MIDLNSPETGNTFLEVENTNDQAGHKDTSTYTFLQDERVRHELGKEMFDFVENIQQQNPDVLIFLDKSGRPASWLFRALWKNVYPHLKCPEIKFVNIGTEKKLLTSWLAGREKLLQNPAVIKELSQQLDPEVVKNFQQAFQYDQQNVTNDNHNRNYLDNKSVMIVDEHSDTGASLIIAQALFEAAFAIRSPRPVSTISIFSHEPPWFQVADITGVKDGNPNDMHTRSITPIPNESLELRRDLGMLADETITLARKGKLY